MCEGEWEPHKKPQGTTRLWTMFYAKQISPACFLEVKYNYMNQKQSEVF